MKRFHRLIAVCWIALLGLFPLASPAAAQSPAELDRVLQELFRGIDPETDALLQQMLQRQPGSDSPDRRVARDVIQPSPRQIGRHEKQHPDHLASYRALVQQASHSTVSLYSGKSPIVLGTVVDREGYVVTKASEVDESQQLWCRTHDGKRFAAQIVATDPAEDLALLKVNARNLQPIRWSDTPPAIGSFVVTADAEGDPLAVGVVSVDARPVIDTNRALLGVAPEPGDGGVKVANVRRDSAAALAGLQQQDLILSIDGEPTTSVSKLVNWIRMQQPGDQITIRYLREGRIKSAVAKLQGATVELAQNARFRMMNEMGATPSRRSSDFPLVLQHDSPLWPRQCGGPLVDLSGRAVGLNIARGGRVKSYAIPGAHVKDVVRRLKSKARLAG